MKKRFFAALAVAAMLVSVLAPSAGAWVGDLRGSYASAVGGLTSIVYSVTDRQVIFQVRSPITAGMLTAFSQSSRQGTAAGEKSTRPISTETD